MTLKTHDKFRRVNKVLYVPSNPHQAGVLQHFREMYWKELPNLKGKWRKIRRSWMKTQETIYGKGNLTCAICGKSNLDPWSRDKINLATCDHIRPFSKAPHLWDDVNNFQVACHKCNSVKDSIQ
jgi:5-methylcytosine-specific restriction endonuclease McrA